MLYVCIATRNNGPTVGPLLWKLRKVFQEFPREYHILVADDGSTDGAGETLSLKRTMGRISYSGDSWELRGGKTPVLEVSEAARTLVLLRDDVEVARHPVTIAQDRVDVIRR